MKIRDMINRRINLHSDYKRTFNTPEGQRVLRHLMKVGKVTKPVAHPDRDQSLRNEGAQHLVLSILNFVSRSPDEIADTTNQSIKSNDY